MIRSVPSPAAIIIHGDRDVLYSYFSSQEFITSHASGLANKNDNKTKDENCRANIFHISGIDAPNTFLTPIYFVRCSVTKDANPNKPRQEIKTARIVKVKTSFPSCCSSKNLFAYCLSTNS